MDPGLGADGPFRRRRQLCRHTAHSAQLGRHAVGQTHADVTAGTGGARRGVTQRADDRRRRRAGACRGPAAAGLDGTHQAGHGLGGNLGQRVHPLPDAGQDALPDGVPRRFGLGRCGGKAPDKGTCRLLCRRPDGTDGRCCITCCASQPANSSHRCAAGTGDAVERSRHRQYASAGAPSCSAGSHEGCTEGGHRRAGGDGDGHQPLKADRSHQHTGGHCGDLLDGRGQDIVPHSRLGRHVPGLGHAGQDDLPHRQGLDGGSNALHAFADDAHTLTGQGNFSDADGHSAQGLGNVQQGQPRNEGDALGHELEALSGVAGAGADGLDDPGDTVQHRPESAADGVHHGGNAATDGVHHPADGVACRLEDVAQLLTDAGDDLAHSVGDVAHQLAHRADDGSSCRREGTCHLSGGITYLFDQRDKILDESSGQRHASAHQHHSSAEGHEAHRARRQCRSDDGRAKGQAGQSDHQAAHDADSQRSLVSQSDGRLRYQRKPRPSQGDPDTQGDKRHGAGQHLLCTGTGGRSGGFFSGGDAEQLPRNRPEALSGHFDDGAAERFYAWDEGLDDFEALVGHQQLGQLRDDLGDDVGVILEESGEGF